MAGNSFNFTVKRSAQTGNSEPTSQTYFTPQSREYRKAVLSCTIGAMERPSEFYSFPLLKWTILNRIKQSI
jgi:hypothetical protein